MKDKEELEAIYKYEPTEDAEERLDKISEILLEDLDEEEWKANFWMDTQDLFWISHLTN